MPSLVKRFVRWSHARRSRLFKAVSAISGALFFLLAIPLFFWLISSWADRWLGSLPLSPYPVGLISGSILVVLGLLLTGWSAWAQLKLGWGTPVPLAPTKRLITTGPYGLCRNPMTLGELLYLTGLALSFSSPSFLVLTWALLFPIVVAYLKLVEERELEARFGEAYLAYKREVPFMLPRFRRPRGPRGGDGQSGKA